MTHKSLGDIRCFAVRCVCDLAANTKVKSSVSRMSVPAVDVRILLVKKKKKTFSALLLVWLFD